MYWDSSCIIALMDKRDHTSEANLNSLRAAFEAMLDGELTIVLSDLHFVEVFKGSMAEHVKELLATSPNIEIVDVRTAMYVRAGELRKACDEAGESLKAADSIHVAIAEAARVDELWTTDKALVSKHQRGLVSTVRIVEPNVGQWKLPHTDTD